MHVKYKCFRAWSAMGSIDYMHGGQYRSLQIDEILSGSGNPAVEHLVGAKLVWVNISCSAVLTIFRIIKNHSLRSFEDLVRICKYSAGISYAMKLWGPANVCIVWEHTRCYPILLNARLKKLPVIAFPHNIESLVKSNTSPFDRRDMPYSLEKEIKLLKMADAIYTITSEEGSMLRDCGIEAKTIPYWPPRDIINKTKLISEGRRAKIQKTGVLIIGSATNTPTAESIRYLIDLINKDERMRCTVCTIIGWGTEIFKFYESNNIVVKGGVSRDELENEMISCSCALVYQKEGAGALTRIPELLLSEVPVLTNVKGVRGFDYLQSEITVINESNIVDSIINGEWVMPSRHNVIEKIDVEKEKADSWFSFKRDLAYT